MSRTKAKPIADVADEFDQPPPRRRPQGDPVPRYVTLPPGEEAVPLYLGWEKAGRIPAGTVLARFDSRYTLAAYPDGSPKGPLGKVGAAIPVDGRRHVTVVYAAWAGALYVVLAPREGS
jgi:hypothetical protein